MTTTTETVTRQQIEVLMGEAGAAGDMEQVRLCGLALGWFRPTGPYTTAQRRAVEQCVEAISSAEAMSGEVA